MFLRSASGVSMSFATQSASFLTGSLSPVRDASSACKSRLSIKRPSAGTFAPVSMQTISPTTKSFWLIRRTFPLRKTFAGTSSLILFKASNAFADFPSMVKEMATDSPIAMTIPTHSMYSVGSPFISRITLTPTAIIAATISISTIGSNRESTIFFIKDSFGGLDKEFVPKRTALSTACSSDNPLFSDTSRLFKTCSFVCR